MTPAAKEHGARTGPQIQSGDLRVIDAAGERSNRKENGLAARKRFRPPVVGFALRAIGPREDRGWPTSRADPQQAGRAVVGRGDDRVVGDPGGAAHDAVQRGDRGRWPARHFDPLQHLGLVHERDPLAVRGDERRGRGAREHGDGFQRVQRADEELRSAIAHIDDA